MALNSSKLNQRLLGGREFQTHLISLYLINLLNPIFTVICNRHVIARFIIFSTLFSVPLNLFFQNSIVVCMLNSRLRVPGSILSQVWQRHQQLHDPFSSPMFNPWSYVCILKKIFLVTKYEQKQTKQIFKKRFRSKTKSRALNILTHDILKSL